MRIRLHLVPWSVVMMFKMKILSWNIRKANNHAKRRRVKNVINEIYPDWIGL